MKKHSIKSALCRTAAFLLMFVLLAGVFSVNVFAEEPIQKSAYDTYTYWASPGTEFAVSATPAYEFDRKITGADLGITALKEPTDIYVDSKGLIYVMDSGNSRVVVINPDLTLNTVIEGLSKDGEVLDFAGSNGLFVRDNGNIYIADTEHARVIITNLKKQVVDILTLPEEELIPEDFNYRPCKIAVDSKGFTYILSDGSYYGALLYKPDGTFSGFFGSNSVKGSIMGIFKKIREKLFVSESKKLSAAKSLPYSFTDITLDDKDFVYTATGAVGIWVSNVGQLKKLSPGGTNVLKDKTSSTVKSAETTNFSDGKAVDYPSESGLFGRRVSDLCAMDVDKYGFMYGLCRNYGHIFIYDQECNQLSVFGGGVSAGTQGGTFSKPCSIHVDDTNQNVLILDNMNLSITVYKETEYGALLKKAQSLTNQGSYEEAKTLWEKVISKDRNCQMAYLGLARAALMDEDYETAAKYSKMGFDQNTYTSAYSHIRNDYLSRNFVWIFILLVVFMGALVFFLVYTNKHKLKLIKNEKLSTMFQCMTHPFQGAQQVRYYNKGSPLLATVLLILFVISSICYDIYSGFMYEMLDKSAYNALYTVLSNGGLVLLWVVVNWAMSTLFQGKGKMKHVYVTTCYALMPLILNNVLQIILTNVLTPEEGLLINAINTICVALALIMLCIGTMTIHEFGFFKFIGLTIVILLSMFVSIFVLLMVFVLIQQLITFIRTLYKEVAYR